MKREILNLPELSTCPNLFLVQYLILRLSTFLMWCYFTKSKTINKKMIMIKAVTKKSIFLIISSPSLFRVGKYPIVKFSL